jgi:putative ABC transport system substrate-binding protein
MKRRSFITLFGGAAATWPLAARAQQPGKLSTVGLLGTGTPSTQGQWNAAFVQRLHELGWTEGRNIAIEQRWAEGRRDRVAEIAAEFIRLRADVIVVAGSNAVIAVKQATAVIPIVSPIMGDPVETGLVASLARPGGNITGLTIGVSGLSSKRVEFLRELIPDVRRLAFMVVVGKSNAAISIHEVQAAAQTLGFEVVTVQIRRAEDIAPAIEGLKGRTDALYIDGDPLMTTNRVSINTLAVGAKLPTLYVQRQYVEAGGLMSYGPNVPDLFRRAGDYVDKILRGAKPADLPVEQPTKFDLVVNLSTAKALGLKIPEAFLLRADEVIEYETSRLMQRNSTAKVSTGLGPGCVKKTSYRHRAQNAAGIRIAERNFPGIHSPSRP